MLIERHAGQLAGMATTAVGQDPTLQAVGLVIDNTAPEAAAVRRQMAPGAMAKELDDVMLALVHRSEALKLLRTLAPAALDWLEPDSAGPERVLPIIAVCPTGCILGAARYKPRN